MKRGKVSAKVLTDVILAQGTRIKLSLLSLVCVHKLFSAVVCVLCQVSISLSQQPKGPNDPPISGEGDRVTTETVE